MNDKIIKKITQLNEDKISDFVDLCKDVPLIKILNHDNGYMIEAQIMSCNENSGDFKVMIKNGIDFEKFAINSRTYLGTIFTHDKIIGLECQLKTVGYGFLLFDLPIKMFDIDKRKQARFAITSKMQSIQAIISFEGYSLRPETFELYDISIGGFSLKVPLDKYELFNQGESLDIINMKIAGKMLKTPATIMNSFIIDNKFVKIGMKFNRDSMNTKVIIQDYVQKNFRIDLKKIS